MPEAHRPTPGLLQLRGLRCPGRHGAYPGEQRAQRVFLADVAVATDLRPAAEADALGAALDFAALAAAIREVVAGEPRTLLETVAVAAAREVLRRFPAAESVRLRLAKPDPPGLEAAEEAVEVQLARVVAPAPDR